MTLWIWNKLLLSIDFRNYYAKFHKCSSYNNWELCVHTDRKCENALHKRNYALYGLPTIYPITSCFINGLWFEQNESDAKANGNQIKSNWRSRRWLTVIYGQLAGTHTAGVRYICVCVYAHVDVWRYGDSRTIMRTDSHYNGTWHAFDIRAAIFIHATRGLSVSATALAPSGVSFTHTHLAQDARQ